ncbi:hypothetical protein HIM_09535 [Hirsutella minnesotensis 3608]|uniref:Tryprostatin B 6-hydroxylase n=1 Tax=Hirsutella minnesotensis 3608 TaxID=1043627 RepID=A0A0F7ZSB3_9HYPO|nr:hypothetical protein HIM_09535 [Hirsutella minnesotensis 3608]
MPSMSLAIQTSSALFGVGSHVAYFIKGEHHPRAPLYAKLVLLGPCALTPVLIFSSDESTRTTCLNLLSIGLWYLVGLFLSILTYRLFLHPLRSYPGPLGARISGMWFTSQVASERRAFEKVENLHEQYGPFVRIGPSALAVNHPDAIETLFGSKSKCFKGDWYDSSNSLFVTLHSARQKSVHGPWRRLWSGAFGDQQLRSYEGRIVKVREKLVAKFQASAKAKEALDVTEQFHYFNFDVTSDLAFGNSLDTLDDPSQRWTIETMQKGATFLELFLPAWIFVLLVSIPGADNGFLRFARLCRQLIEKRIKNEPDKPDIMATILAQWKDKKITPEGKKALFGDAQLIIVAGSDTSSAVMSVLSYEFARNPSHVEKLRKELAPFTVDGRVDFARIQNLDHLNGVINEAMRLFPPVPSIIPRLTPPEGVEIGGRYIPGNTTVACSQYVLNRTESLYPQANEFIPERWYSKPEMVTDKSIFVPFSIGPYNCIGKSLALQNIRNTIAELVTRFDFSPGPNNDMDLYKKGARDAFTLQPARLRLNISFAKSDEKA